MSVTLDLTTTRVAVTGGNGFLGTAVRAQLQRLDCRSVAAPRRRDYDLRREEDVQALYADLQPEVVLHLAGTVGGIGANRSRPGQFFYDNAIMGIHMLEYARRAGLRKLVCIGSVCGYPRQAPVPFAEEHLWDGYPEPSNAAYGLAKRMMLVQAQAYRREYGLNAIYLIPTNLYGPHDNFDPETSHAIAAIIRKMTDARRAGDSQVVLWGDGSPTRDFLYVDDAADGILKAARHYDGAEPVNLGSGQDIAIRDLAETLKDVTGFSGRIVWDPSRPAGQRRRRVQVERARRLFGFSATTPLRAGLERTVAWYVRHCEAGAPQAGAVSGSNP